MVLQNVNGRVDTTKGDAAVLSPWNSQLRMMNKVLVVPPLPRDLCWATTQHTSTYGKFRALKASAATHFLLKAPTII